MKKPFLQNIIANVAGSGIARILGALVPVIIAWRFGIGADTDIFFFAFAIIMFLTSIFSSTMETISVPFLAAYKRDGINIGSFIGMVLIIIIALTALLAISCAVLLVPILRLATRFSLQQVDHIRNMVLFIIPVFTSVVSSSIVVGALNVESYFFVPSISSSFRSVVGLAFIYFGSGFWGIYVLPSGYIVGEFLRVAMLYCYALRKQVFHLRFDISIWPHVREFLHKGSFHVGSALLGGLNPLVDRSLSLWIGLGSISIIEYADRLNAFPVMLLLSIFPVILSRWSNDETSSSIQRLRIQMWRALKMLFLPTLLLIVAGVAFSESLVRFVYQHGGFPKEKVLIVSYTFSAYLIGLMPYILSQIIVQGYIVRKATRVLFFFAAVRVILNIVFDYIFMQIWGVVGIAISSTACTFIITILLILPFYDRSNENANAQKWLGKTLHFLKLDIIESA